jgi:hypothetical protein
VLVVVIPVDCMPVPVMQVVDVLIMRHGLVAAVRSVLVPVVGVRQMRQRVLVIVSVVRRVGVSFMHIVDVPLALHAGVPAAGTVLVVVVPVAWMGVVVGRYH